MVKTKHRLWGYAILTLLLGVMFLTFILFPELRQFGSPEYVRGLIIGFGSIGFLIYIALASLSVPFPIPSTPLIFVAGYLFGNVLGVIFGLLSMMLGSIVSFYITRKSGRPLLEKLVDEHHLRHFDAVLKKRGTAAILIAYALPIFPSDTVSLIMGVTKMPMRKFIWLVFLGHIPRIAILISLGADVQQGFSPITIIVIIGAVIFLVIALLRERIKRWIFKEIHLIESKFEHAKKR